MPGLEPVASGAGSNRSANCAMTTVLQTFAYNLWNIQPLPPPNALIFSYSKMTTKTDLIFNHQKTGASFRKNCL